MTLEEIRTLLNVDPKLITGVIVAFGLKDLLWEFVKRRWAKEDECENDHKILEEMQATLKEIQAKLEILDMADKESLDNDILILEHNILFLQRKAIKYGKVSKGCMPRYRILFKRYKSLLDKSNLDINEEADTNNEIVEKMFHDGLVVDSFWEMK